MPALLLMVASLSSPPPKIDSQFVKVGFGGETSRRAVVLIHGLGLSPLNSEKPTKAALRTWQQSDSVLVKQLAADADVYSFAYAQTVAVEKVHEAGGLAKSINRLKSDGYREIVLIGHSAGGLVARHLIEDHPDLGVTRVIQVCSPNLGSTLAALKTARGAQQVFLSSLTCGAREGLLKNRKDVTIPNGIEFACIVGSVRLGTDGIVACKSQWTEDLQKQGVPAYLLHTAHWEATKTAKGAEFIAKLALAPQPRWKADQVREAKKKVLGD